MIEFAFRHGTGGRPNGDERFSRFRWSTFLTSRAARCRRLAHYLASIGRLHLPFASVGKEYTEKNNAVELHRDRARISTTNGEIMKKLKGLSNNLFWPAAAGNVFWSFWTVIIDGNWKVTWPTLVFLFLLASYLSVEWLVAKDDDGNPGFYVVFSDVAYLWAV